MISSDYKTEKQARAYLEHRFHKGLNKVNQDELRLLDTWIAEFETRKNLTFADLGTGTGRFLNTLLKYSPNKVFALDQSRAMLDQLGKKYLNQIKSKNIELIVSSAEKTGLKTKSIDLVTAFHLMKHLPNILPTIREVSRILKKDSYFIFEVLNTNSIIKLNLGTCVAISEENLRKILLNNNFKIIKIAYLHPLGETVYNIPIFLIPLVQIFEKLVNMFLPSAGTKIFIKAIKND